MSSLRDRIAHAIIVELDIVPEDARRAAGAVARALGMDPSEEVSDLGGPVSTVPCYHVTTTSGRVYGVAASTRASAVAMVAYRLAGEEEPGWPRYVEHVGTWEAAYGTVLAY